MKSVITALALIVSIFGSSHSTIMAKSIIPNQSEIKENVKLEKKQEIPITINFVGDILLGGSLAPIIQKNGVDYPFAKVSKTLKDADITFGNLETSVSKRGIPAKKQYTFRSNPETLQGLVNAGFDGVSLANNHTLDYGSDALLDTIQYLKDYKLGFAGAGKNINEAFKAYTKVVNGKKVAIVAVSRVLPEGSWFAGQNKLGIASAYTNEPMMTYIKNAVKGSDYTIVYIHWNKERQDYPESYAPKMAKQFIDLGVDAVIGGHSHSLMGMEFYKNKPIYYSIGNFIFKGNTSSKSSETMIVNLTLQGENVSTKVTPLKIINGQPNFMGKEYDNKIIKKLNQLSYNAKVDSKGNVTVK